MSWWIAFLLGAVVAAACGPWAWQRLRRALQVLQLEEYENVRALRWGLRHWPADYAPAFLALLTVLVVVYLVASFAGNAATAAGAGAALAFVALITPLRVKAPVPKKPLSVTARVKRLLFALAIVVVVLMGVMLLLGRLLNVSGGAAVIVLPLLAWLAIAAGPLPVVLANLLAGPLEAAYRRRFRNEAIARLRAVSPRIVAITGSYGKTTTKELIAAVLEARYKVLKTPASFNTVMGITRVVREQLRDEHEIFVVEMGAYKRGEIRALCEFVGGPDLSAIVGINEQHLERMGSIENTQRAKYEIVEGTKPGGVSVFNVDNRYCAALADKTAHVRVLRVGTDGSRTPPLDLWADNVTVTPKLMRFDVHSGEQTATVRTRMLGRHLVPNFLIAIAMGLELGVELRTAVSRLGVAQPVGHRLAVSEVDGRLLIDDAYSSNVDGARAALELLAELPAQRRVLVTPGIVELGAQEAVRNRELGAQAAKVCDLLLVVGATPGQFVREGALAAGMRPECAIACTNLAASQQYLREHGRAGDAVLFENDLPDNYA